MKVYRLPVGNPQSRGKALVNLLPLDEGETIAAVMALPSDETSWSDLHVMFATSFGNVRRNDLSDFVQINRNGKIAMKPDQGEQIVGVDICTENDDVLLTASDGRCIRFPVTAVRVFRSRNSSGVRGIRLADGQEVISMAILRHSDASPAERNTYLKQANAIRRASDDTIADIETPITDDISEEDGEEANELATLTPERYAQLGAEEQFILTVSENGFGKRSSAYEYRISGRGGKGIIAMTVTERNGQLIAAFPVEDSDQLMLVTNNGTLIRTTVIDVRIAGRNTQGVTIFKTEEDARVMSVVRIGETSDDEEDTEDTLAEHDTLGGDVEDTNSDNANPGSETSQGEGE